MSATPALEVTALAAGYVGSPVIRDLSFALAPGEVLCLLGPNGAGKTTTLLALSGLLARSAGTVTVNGVALPAGRPRAAARAGLAFVPDDRSLFRTLTVAENLALAATSKSRIADVLDLFPLLRERLKVHAGLLSGGEQQQLALGRALVQDPKVLMVDELSMGLAPVIVEHLLPVIRQVADETGTAVILVEQHFRLALGISDQAIVLAHGTEVLRGATSELLAKPEQIEAAYLGGKAA